MHLDTGKMRYKMEENGEKTKPKTPKLAKNANQKLCILGRNKNIQKKCSL